MQTDPKLADLAEHLAYHASVGFAECRGLDLPEGRVPTPEATGRTDGEDVEFTVCHEDVEYLVTVERVVKERTDGRS
jgi:hypothetical protein